MSTYVMICISLGAFCLPRVFLKYELNITKENGYKSCPFDLCITPFSALIQCLKTDFEHFFDLSFKMCTSFPDGDRSLCEKGVLEIVNKYGMTFNHESSTHSHLFKYGKNDNEHYTRNNFFEFKKRYTQRINNFREYMKNDTIHFYIINPESVNYDELKDIYPTKNIILHYVPLDYKPKGI